MPNRFLIKVKREDDKRALKNLKDRGYNYNPASIILAGEGAVAPVVSSASQPSIVDHKLYSQQYELLIQEIRKRPKAEQLEALGALSDIRKKNTEGKDSQAQKSEVNNLSVVQKEEDKKATKKVTFQLPGE